MHSLFETRCIIFTVNNSIGPNCSNLNQNFAILHVIFKTFMGLTTQVDSLTKYGDPLPQQVPICAHTHRFCHDTLTRNLPRQDICPVLKRQSQ